MFFDVLILWFFLFETSDAFLNELLNEMLRERRERNKRSKNKKLKMIMMLLMSIIIWKKNCEIWVITISWIFLSICTSSVKQNLHRKFLNLKTTTSTNWISWKKKFKFQMKFDDEFRRIFWCVYNIVVVLKNNICFHCYVFQYNEKCHVKFNFSKYWHCCFNDKIFDNIMTSENDDIVIEILFDNFEKNIMRLINVRIKREFHDLLWKYELNEIKSTSEKFKYKKIKRCKKFTSWMWFITTFFFLQRDDENEL